MEHGFCLKTEHGCSMLRTERGREKVGAYDLARGWSLDVSNREIPIIR